MDNFFMWIYIVIVVGVIATIIILVGQGIYARVGGNKVWLDTNYTFNKAEVYVGDKKIEIDIEKWNDYENGEQIQIVSKDGTVYLVSSFNTVLIGE